MIASASRDRISVELRGLKAVLLAHAQAHGLSPSRVIRDALAVALGGAEASAIQDSALPASAKPASQVRVSIRLGANDARALRIAAGAAQLPLGAYLAGLAGGVPALGRSIGRKDTLAALITSNAELATLSRNVHHLTSLLNQGSVRAAQVYRDTLDDLTKKVHEHLALASALLVDLQPGRSNQGPVHEESRQPARRHK